MMVLVDNHVSDPKWCCDNNDGNGFFGDQFFDPKEWLEGLSNVANRVKAKPQVVAIGMRNELRGPNQEKDNWHKYMSQGATIVHKANPNILVFISGLNYDTDLSFLKTNPLNVSIGNKLVYEVHSYAWSIGSPNDWNEQPMNQKCANVMNNLNDKAGFLMSGSNPNPLVMTEFGMDMFDIDDKNQRFMSCMLAYLAGVDLDWALWAAQEFSQRFQLVQKKLLEPSSNSIKSYIIYHPLSGQCVKVNNNHELELGDCDGQTTNLHLSTLDGNGQNLCLQRESSTSPKIVTKKCICVDDNPTCLDDPQSQWFQLVTTNV
ncbi:hypothetical protein TSUD_170540 [Trifolium subterraneum]|uniref:Glycoside hydrolase family 5 domain-containing protein n=1 Tax=Trifolium subterraneum TaxID=3900 RepID=A0A2Z6MBP9_TRISU|nr:hypothetical protein TSUD_170540 [Trifolium subterraneum]